MNAASELLDAPFAAADRLARFERQVAGAGAIVSFSGIARETGAEGARIEALVLEAYRGATIASMEAISSEAHARFDILASDVAHRAGRIAPGETIVFVAVAAAHRRAAFEAADYMMDALKTRAIFWKREEAPGSRRWIEPTARDRSDAGRWQDSE